MKILFIDPECPTAMVASGLGRQAMGGTEATLFHIARELAREHTVAIAQHNRIGETVEDEGICFQGFNFSSKCPAADQPDHIIVLRNYKILPRIRQQYPDAAISLWMHCFPGSRWRRAGQIFDRTGANIIAVSDTLRKDMVQMLSKQLSPEKAESLCHTIYNPVVLQTTGGHPMIREDVMIYLSSPHKGLNEVLTKFNSLREHLPSLELEVANPGYIKNDSMVYPPGVRILGALPQKELHRRVASSLCVFYPQTRFAETFGLIFGEANALQTPVIAHDLGAAREILNLGGEGQVIDCNDLDAIALTLKKWQENGRLPVQGSGLLKLETVVKSWGDYLGVETGSSLAQAA